MSDEITHQVQKNIVSQIKKNRKNNLVARSPKGSGGKGSGGKSPGASTASPGWTPRSSGTSTRPDDTPRRPTQASNSLVKPIMPLEGAPRGRPAPESGKGGITAGATGGAGKPQGSTWPAGIGLAHYGGLGGSISPGLNGLGGPVGIKRRAPPGQGMVLTPPPTALTSIATINRYDKRPVRYNYRRSDDVEGDDA